MNDVIAQVQYQTKAIWATALKLENEKTISDETKDEVIKLKELEVISTGLENALKIAEIKLTSAQINKLAADIYRRGLYITGGGSLLRGLDKRLSQKIKLPVHVADDPLKSVVRGTGIALKNYQRFPFIMR